MKVAIALLIYAILHIVALVALVLIYMGAIYHQFLIPALTILGILILIDLLLTLYYLIRKPSKKEGGEYHKLKIEEVDKHLAEKDEKI